MDHREYTSLAAALADVPDPRQARGRRYPWELIVTLIAAAIASGPMHGRAIGQWVEDHAETLQTWLEWEGARLPSEATLRRGMQEMGVQPLEERLAQWSAELLATDDEAERGDALDGKWVRGAGTHGAPVQLLCLARHDGMVGGQIAVPPGTSEITAAPALLAAHDLRGRVITADALLTQRQLSEQIVAQGGDYLLAIKGNHPELAAELVELFATGATDPSALPVAQVRTIAKGHGRLEIREIAASPLLNDWLRWPAVGQVLKQTCRRSTLRTGVVTETVRYAITSLPFGTDLSTIARLWRGHWNIENKVHYVRDVTCREDAGQAYRGNTPQVLAALRNAVLTLLRARGWLRIADALRHFATHPMKALALVTGRRL
jgi:predicted transposase YbfD/YdcC